MSAAERQLTVADIKAINARHLRQQNASSIAGWTPELVRSAQTALSKGDWGPITRLGRKITTDSTIASALEKRVNALVQRRFSALPGDNSPDARLVAEVVQHDWERRFVSEVQLCKVVSDLVLYDLFVGYVTWSLDETGVRYPCLQVVNTEHVRYDENWCEWQLQSREGRVTINPGDGNWILITSWTPGDVVGAAAHLGLDWIYLQMTKATWVDGNRTSASPTVIITEPLEGTAGDPASVDALIAEFAAKMADGVGYLRRGLKADVISRGESWKPDSLKSFTEYLKASISTYLNGGNLSNDVKGGSFAAATVHQGAADDLTRGDAMKVSTGLHEQMLVPFCEFNVNGDVAAPWPTWSMEAEQDASVKLETLLKFKELLGDQWTGISDPAELAGELGITLLPADELQEPDEAQSDQG